MIDTFLAYVAGIVDGEGCISIASHNKRRNTFYPRVCVAMTKANKLLRLLKNKYGGSLLVHKLKSRKVETRWLVTCRQAENFLRNIYPYLRIKQKNAELVFELNERISLGMPNGKNICKLAGDEVKARRQIFDEMRKLNS